MDGSIYAVIAGYAAIFGLFTIGRKLIRLWQIEWRIKTASKSISHLDHNRKIPNTYPRVR